MALKKNCKIGGRTVIMPGVIIGENAVVGACSFVNRDIPDNAAAFGVPAVVQQEVPTRQEADERPGRRQRRQDPEVKAPGLVQILHKPRS